MIVDALQLAADQALDVRQIGPFLPVAEGNGRPRGASPTGAADAVDVGLRDVRKVVVDDVRDAVDIDPARSEVGGPEDPQLAGPEGIE